MLRQLGTTIVNLDDISYVDYNRDVKELIGVEKYILTEGRLKAVPTRIVTGLEVTTRMIASKLTILMRSEANRTIKFRGKQADLVFDNLTLGNDVFAPSLSIEQMGETADVATLFEHAEFDVAVVGKPAIATLEEAVRLFTGCSDVKGDLPTSLSYTDGDGRPLQPGSPLQSFTVTGRKS